MKNMSFSLTTNQIRNRTKTVTRRLGWRNLKPGDLIQAVVKGMGLKKGEKVQRLCVICVVGVRRECLDRALVERHSTVKEGFPNLTRRQFVDLFSKHNRCRRGVLITRIEFEYI